MQLNMLRLGTLILVVSALCAQDLPSCFIETVAGGGVSVSGDGGPALEVDILRIRDIAAGPEGSVYFADDLNRTLWRIFPDGHIESLAGAGELDLPSALTVAPNGDVYFFESGTKRISRITAAGVRAPIAGDGSSDFSGDAGPAVQAGIGFVSSLDLGPDGSLYLAGSGHQRVRRIRPDGVIETVAGSGPAHVNDGFDGGDGGPAVEARLHTPLGVAVDAPGVLYIADSRNNRIRRVGLDGVITTVAGNGGRGRATDGFDPLSGIGRVRDIAIGPDNRLYFTDVQSRSAQGVFRLNPDGLAEQLTRTEGSHLEVTPTGSILTLRLGGVARSIDFLSFEAVAGPGGNFGEGKPALTAPLVGLRDIAVDDDGVLLLGESLGRLRSVGSDGVLRTFSSQGGIFVAVGPGDFVYVWGVFGDVVHRIDAAGAAVRFAGGGSGCGAINRRCEDRPATDVIFDRPFAHLDFDSAGRAYFIQSSRNYDSLIRSISPDGILTTPRLDFGRNVDVKNLQVDAQDRVLILVDGDELWRWSPPDGSLERLFDFTGPLTSIRDFAVAPDGRIYLFDSLRDVLWVLTPDGVLDFIAGRRNFPRARSGDGGPAIDARFEGLANLAVSPNGDLYLQDSGVVRRISRVGDCPVTRRPLTAAFGAKNGASFTRRMAAGQIVSIFGAGLGPDDPITARLESGRLSTELSGVRVLVDDLPAPLVFVSSRQVSAIIPYGVQVFGRRNDAGNLVFDDLADIVVERDSVRSQPIRVGVAPSSPGLFTANSSGQGPAAALNQDGSFNSAETPAAPGSVVVLFATGEGETDPAGVDGKLAAAPLPRPLLPVIVEVNSRPVDVLYAGGAPGFTAGLMQLNLRLPPDLRGTLTVVLRVGDESSAPVTVSVAP